MENEKSLQCRSSLGRELAVKDEDVPLLLAVLGGRRNGSQLLPVLHEHVPHHVFGPQVDGIGDVTALEFVRIPAMINPSKRLGRVQRIKQSSFFFKEGGIGKANRTCSRRW